MIIETWESEKAIEDFTTSERFRRETGATGMPQVRNASSRAAHQQNRANVGGGAPPDPGGVNSYWMTQGRVPAAAFRRRSLACPVPPSGLVVTA